MKGTLLLDRLYHFKPIHPVAKKKEFRMSSAQVDLTFVSYEHPSKNNNNKMQSATNNKLKSCKKQDDFTLTEPSYFDLYPDLDDFKIETITTQSRWVRIFERFNLSFSKVKNKD